jgi:hypothetical protein
MAIRKERLREVTTLEHDVSETRWRIPTNYPRVRRVGFEVHDPIRIGTEVELSHAVAGLGRRNLSGATSGQDLDAKALVAQPRRQRDQPHRLNGRGPRYRLKGRPVFAGGCQRER